MSGETSKSSGEIGEKLASRLLQMLGWKALMHNVSIDCVTDKHVNAEGNPRKSHGEDQIFLYHNPFHDDRTDVVHVSNKNAINGYLSSKLKTDFKSHIRELSETAECASFGRKLNEICKSFKTKKTVSHSGLLIWLHNDEGDLERDIKGDLENSRLDSVVKIPIYLVDSNRASFLLNVVDDASKREGEYEFYYPRIGTSLSVDEQRSGKVLPLELIAAEVVPVVIRRGEASELVIYANQEFNQSTYKALIGYALTFSAGWVKKISIGTKDYNPARDKEEADLVRMSFHERQEDIVPFSYNRSILALIAE